jgi:hypothetical protein
MAFITPFGGKQTSHNPPFFPSWTAWMKWNRFDYCLLHSDFPNRENKFFRLGSCAGVPLLFRRIILVWNRVWNAAKKNMWCRRNESTTSINNLSSHFMSLSLTKM